VPNKKEFHRNFDESSESVSLIY